MFVQHCLFLEVGIGRITMLGWKAGHLVLYTLRVRTILRMSLTPQDHSQEVISPPTAILRRYLDPMGYIFLHFLLFVSFVFLEC